MESIWNCKRRSAERTKLGMAAIAIKLLLVAFSQQAVPLNFAASQIAPMDTNTSFNPGSYHVSTNLVAWDNGVANKPIYIAQRTGLALVLWNENNV